MGFYIFFELSLIPLIAIVVGWGYQVERVQAAFYLFIYTIFGSLPLLAVIIYINFRLGSLLWVRNIYDLGGGL
jgi:NADH-ubiquinone oxidoreductase chain 4